MAHEVARPEGLFRDIRDALKAGGELLLAEPSGHVRREALEATLRLARDSGFALESRPAIWHGHTAVLVRKS